MGGRVTGSWVPESWVLTGVCGWPKWEPGSGWSWHLSRLVYIRPKSARSLPRVGQANGGRVGSARSLGVGGGRGGRLEAVCEVNQFSAASQGAAPWSPASPWGGRLISNVNSLAHPTESEIQG